MFLPSNLQNQSHCLYKCNCPSRLCTIGNASIWDRFYSEWCRSVCVRSGLCPLEIVPIRNCAHSKLCPFWIVLILNCAHSELSPFEIVPIRNCAYSKLCPFWIVPIRIVFIQDLVHSRYSVLLASFSVWLMSIILRLAMSNTSKYR